MPIRCLSAYRGVVLALALAPALASATTYTWPGSAPCATTLQACIDAVADGSRVEIATNAAIAEDISLYNRSLSLTAASGYVPAFGTGHWLSVTSSGLAGDLNIYVSRLRFSDGYVFANYNGGGTASYDFEELTLTRASSDSANYIEVDANGGTLNATLFNNRVSGVPRSLNSGLIQLGANGAVLNAAAYYNHVTNTAAGAVNGGGILADLHANGATAAGGTLKLHGNEVRGAFNRAGIFISEGLSSSTPSHFNARVYNNVAIGLDASTAGVGGSGIAFIVNNGSIDAQAINNTLTRCNAGISAMQWFGGGASAGISGAVKNNLVVAYTALNFSLALASLPDNDYNLLNTTTSTIGYGSHTLTSPARLVLDTQPRLRADSAAIDAADTLTLGLGLLFNGLPTNDVDGLRRITGPGSAKADIGAYESGEVDFTHVARGDTISGNVSYIDQAVLNANAGAALIATPNFNIGLSVSYGIANDHPFGAYYEAPNWALFTQDLNPMPPGARFDVLVPANGSGSFVHVTSASNVSGFGTTISNSSTDNLPDRIVLVTQNWSAGGASLYNPHPVGAYYGGDNYWHLANLDGAAMQQSLGFNIYAQEPSPNALRVTATSGNWNGVDQVQLDHPLLDNTPCARPQVTRLLGAGPIGGNFDVFYLNGHWRIFGYGGITLGEQFHVLVSPAQVFDCTDRIFADAFD